MDTLNYRFERKFVVSDRTRQEIHAILRIHPALFSPIYHPRFVHNIYLDSLGLDNYEDTMAGIERRQKVRIRWYGDLFGEITRPTLEIKLKRNKVGAKLSYPLKPFVFDRGFSTATLREVFESSDLPAILRFQLKPLQPTLVNSYYRAYYLSADKAFRVTVDSDLEFRAIRPSCNGFRHCVRDRENLVVELKYPASEDRGAREIANHFPFRLSRHSKYVTGLLLLYTT